jgi:hypothetical protein
MGQKLKAQGSAEIAVEFPVTAHIIMLSRKGTYSFTMHKHTSHFSNLAKSCSCMQTSLVFLVATVQFACTPSNQLNHDGHGAPNIHLLTAKREEGSEKVAMGFWEVPMGVQIVLRRVKSLQERPVVMAKA